MLFNKTTDKIQTSKGEMSANIFVLAGGSWSGELAKKLNYNIPLQAGKGYSFKVAQDINIMRVPVICCETKLAVTPMQNDIRFAGTMEINGFDAKNNVKRIQGIKNSINNYFPNIQIPQIPINKIWSGLRPCSPDGLPYVGRLNNSNVLMASGHAMMGLSLGPITGKLMAELIQEEKSSIDIDKLNPLRFN